MRNVDVFEHGGQRCGFPRPQQHGAAHEYDRQSLPWTIRDAHHSLTGSAISETLLSGRLQAYTTFFHDTFTSRFDHGHVPPLQLAASLDSISFCVGL